MGQVAVATMLVSAASNICIELHLISARHP
jgi:hypothetical protein